MSAVDEARLLDIWETRAATQQLEQYPRLSRDFEELDQAIALLPATRDSPFVPSYQPFLEIVCSNFSPTWTRTSRILSEIFGELGQATKREVPMGCGGIIALRTAVGRTRIDDEKVGEIRHWLDIVTRSVYHTREIIARDPITAESALPDNGAASSTSRSEAAPATPVDSTSSIARTRSATPSPAKVKTSSPQINKGKGRAIETEEEKAEATDYRSREVESQEDQGIGSSSRVLRSRGSTSRAQYQDDEDEDEDDRLGSPLSSLADSEGEDQGGRGVTNEEERPRKKPRHGENEASPARNGPQRRSGRTGSVQRPEAGVISPETIAKETAVRNSFIARMPASSLTPEEWLVREAFSSIPTEIDLSPPSTFNLPPAHSFARRHLTGNTQFTVYDGIGGEPKVWDRFKNNLCLLSDMNLCSFASDDPKFLTPFRPGQPIVFTSHAQKCLEVVEAISELGIRKKGKIKPHTGPKKDKPFIHLFVQAATNDWRYMGDYVVAWDGSQEKGKYQYLDPPSSTVHEVLKEKLEVHATSKNQNGQWPRILLTDWDFKATTWDQAEKELEISNDKGRSRHVKYLVLKCIGWDETSFEKWSEERAKLRGK